MRPLRLDMEGFGTFSKPTTVDFTGADFFALIGPTGAGKSTVLDAICFALYGRVPRWGSGIEYALAPSATSGKVRLVFSADGACYVATRLVKRGGKGKVTTASAALEKLPADIDVSSLDNVSELIGTALAASAKAVGEQVERIIGLPFDQFTKCVLLPQGAFAEFLHSSGAERRKILENLLGYSVYRDIQTAAGEEQKSAEAVLTRIEQELSRVAPVTDEAIAAADARVRTLSEVGEKVRAKVPRLDELTRRAAEAADALKTVDAEHALLTYIRRPDDVDATVRQVAEAAAAVETARSAMTEAEQAEERLRAEAADVDTARIDLLLGKHAELVDTDTKLAKGTTLTEDAEAALAEAKSAQAQRAEQVAAAERALDAARTADLAAAVREHLEPGKPCPVCTQTVRALPEHTGHATVATARQHLDTAKAALKQSEDEFVKLQGIAHKYRARVDQLLESRAALAEALADSPGPQRLQADKEAASTRRAALAQASARVRETRDAVRRAETAHANAADKQAIAWRTFDHHRDRVAALAPPPADRGDLDAAWRSLADWAAEQLSLRAIQRGEHNAAVAKLDEETRIVRNELSVSLTEAGVNLGREASGTDFVEAAAVGLRQAEDDHRRLLEQRDTFVRLTADRAEKSREAQVAKQLHEHLGTRKFVNWLLEEALRELVAGASDILRRLTSGQYDLDYIDYEFYVIDHHDADLPRPVKTLSGGETFAAALALALAMSEQLAGMSSQGASLESILLDEGFGTLDAATLDQVAANLESLATSGNRLVGVVTHVAGLAERIPVRFEVSKDAHGSHVERVEL